MLGKIQRLEREILRLPQTPIRTRHYFPKGLYCREITIPAGVVLTGKVHAGEQFNIVSAGRITVWTGEQMQTVSAPFSTVSPPGIKRVGFAHIETVWTTIHPNPDDETDLEILEARYIVSAGVILPEAMAAELIEGV